MNSDPIQKFLQETDERQSLDAPFDASALTNRVLRSRRNRRRIRIVLTLTLLAISAPILLVVNRKMASPTSELALNPKPALQDRVQLEQELRDLQAQITANDQIIRRLNAIQTIERAEAEISRLQLRDFPEQEIAERAASAVVYQTDRMYRSTGQSVSALQAYREVIEHFPGTASAELAKQRVIDIERAG